MRNRLEGAAFLDDDIGIYKLAVAGNSRLIAVFETGFPERFGHCIYWVPRVLWFLNIRVPGGLKIGVPGSHERLEPFASPFGQFLEKYN